MARIVGWVDEGVEEPKEEVVDEGVEEPKAKK